MSRRVWHRRPVRGDSGQATVELALLLPVVALLLLAVLQLALVARDVVLVTHATREAARAAAVGEDPAAAAGAAGGLDPGRLEVVVEGADDRGARASIRVRYQVPTDVALIGRFIPDVPVKTEVRARVE